MIGDGQRFIYRDPASRARPPGQVDVLEIGEEALVKAAELVEHGRAVQREAAARPEYLARVPSLARRAAGEPLGRDAQRVDVHTGGVDAGGIGMEAHLRGDRSDALVASARGQQSSQRDGLDASVVVEERQPLPARRGHAALDAAGKAHVFAGLDQPDARPALAYERRKATVVDHDQLRAARYLCGCSHTRLKALGQ